MAAPRSSVQLALLAALALTLFAGLCWLGIWQLHRRAWKLELIARVEQRLRTPPVPAPGREAWPGIGPNDEYRAVRTEGTFLHQRETLVQAVTRLGPGFWVLTPLQTREGYTVLINRGFVGPELRDVSSRPAGEPAGIVEITGLLRLSEPQGGFLRRNDPAANRWYSRDVAAIGAMQRLPAQDLASYFIDADDHPNAGGWPVGGLTVVQFRNSHLAYAITWFALALMTAGGAWTVGREEWQARRNGRRQ